MPQGRLSGKRVLLGVSGSIAAYKSVEVLRRLVEQGADVRVAMTKNASFFISPLTFETLSGHPVLQDEFHDTRQNTIGHIDATEALDLAVVAPATANIIGKVASGIADDALTSALVAADCPLCMAPAMNDRMYNNPIVQKNIRFLKDLGVTFIDPDIGRLACGTVGEGRLADAERIIQEVSSLFGPRDLEDVVVLVTAGPTREFLDPVRFISNPSTGKMGYALAAAARDRGADVILITGPTALIPPRDVTLVPVISAEDMHRAVLERSAKSRVIIMAAAVSDFKPSVTFDKKVKKADGPGVLHLDRTADILMELGKADGEHMLVGFAAETEGIVQNAVKKMNDKNLDMIVVNDVLRQGSGFGTDTNAVTIIDRSGRQTELQTMPKTELAGLIIDRIVELRKNKRILP